MFSVNWTLSQCGYKLFMKCYVIFQAKPATKRPAGEAKATAAKKTATAKPADKKNVAKKPATKKTTTAKVVRRYHYYKRNSCLSI